MSTPTLWDRMFRKSTAVEATPAPVTAEPTAPQAETALHWTMEHHYTIEQREMYVVYNDAHEVLWMWLGHVENSNRVEGKQTYCGYNLNGTNGVQLVKKADPKKKAGTWALEPTFDSRTHAAPIMVRDLQVMTETVLRLLCGDDCNPAGKAIDANVGVLDLR